MSELPQDEKTPFPPYLDANQYYELIQKEPKSLAEYLPPDMYREIIDQTSVEDLLPLLNSKIPGLYELALRKIANFIRSELKGQKLSNMSVYNLKKLSKHPVIRKYAVAEAKKEFNRSYVKEISERYPEIIPYTSIGLKIEETTNELPVEIMKYCRITPAMIEEAVLNDNQLRISTDESIPLMFDVLSENKFIDREYIRQTIDRFPWKIKPEMLTDDLAIRLRGEMPQRVWTHDYENEEKFFTDYARSYAGVKFLETDLDLIKRNAATTLIDEIDKYLILQHISLNANISPEFLIKNFWPTEVTPKQLILDIISDLNNFSVISQPYNQNPAFMFLYDQAIYGSLYHLFVNPKWIYVFDDQMINALLTMPTQKLKYILGLAINPELTIDRAIKLVPIMSTLASYVSHSLTTNPAYRLDDVIKILNGVYDNFMQANPPNTPIPYWLNDISRLNSIILRPEDFVKYEYEKLISIEKVRLNLPIKYPSDLSISLNEPNTHLVDIDIHNYTNNIYEGRYINRLLDQIINNF